MLRSWVLLSLILSAACSATKLPTPPESRRGTGGQPEAGEDPLDDEWEKRTSDPWETDPSTVDGPPPATEPGEDDPDIDDDAGDEPDPTGPRKSGGSGGEAGLKEIAFTASNGQASSYKINAPADALTGKVYGLHIHLHGDGGGGYRDFPNSAPAHDLIGVTVKAPNRNLQWGRFSGVPHASYVHELIQNELIKKYDIDLDRIYFSGVSGGAYFLTGNLIPAYGHFYKSGAFVLCGGEPPRVPIADPAALTDFRIYWQVTAGERGDISQSVDASRARYKTLLDAQLLQTPIPQFDPKTVQDFEVAGDGGHCEFDDLPYTEGIQSIINRKFDVVFRP